MLQPIVVEPTELDDKRDRRKKGTKKKRRTTSSTSSANKHEIHSKVAIENSSTLVLKENGRHSEDSLTHKETLSKVDSTDRAHCKEILNLDRKPGKF